MTGSGRLIISSIRDSATHLVEAVEFGALGGGSGRSSTTNTGLSGAGGGQGGGVAELVDDRPLASRLGGFTNSYRNIASLQQAQQQAKQNQLINEATALVEKGEATAEVCFVFVVFVFCFCVCVCVCVCVCRPFSLSGLVERM